MKKAMPGGGSAVKKRKVVAKTVEEYLAEVPQPGRGIIKKMRAVLRSEMPRGTSETISYGIPAFKGKKILVWYAAFSDHCSLFPTSAVVAAFKDELRGLSTSKGTIHFPLDKPLPLTLIKKIARARVAQNESKPKS